MAPWLVIACELADKTLAASLREAKGQGLPGIAPAELLAYLRDAAEAVDHLNSNGVQHRDLKPSNILLMGGAIKVGDYGLAKLLSGPLDSHTGMMTYVYAAPEFFDHKTSSHSDQYSLAVVYCELRGGRLPFTGTPAELMRGHLQGVPDLTMLPAAERPVVARALSKQPGQRWPSCNAFVEQIVQAGQQMTKLASTPPASSPGRSAGRGGYGQGRSGGGHGGGGRARY